MTLAASSFAEMPLAGTALASSPSGGGGGGEEPPIIIVDPFRIEISGVSFPAMNNSLSIDTELGRQDTASFNLVNLSSELRIGQPVRILFYEHVLFSGALDRIQTKSDLSHAVTVTSCECTDNSYLLFRRKIRRTMTNVTISQIASSLLTQELSADGLSIGKVDTAAVIPQVQADNVSAFDLLNNAAVSVGMMFYVDNDKKLNFVSTSIPAAPMTIDETIIEDCSITVDRETFRNQQTVIATGTPATDSEQANTVTYTFSNEALIAQQFSIEGTGGIYNDIQSITHPTSNNTVDLTRLAISYAKTVLAVEGSIRETLSVRTRQ